MAVRPLELLEQRLVFSDLLTLSTSYNNTPHGLTDTNQDGKIDVQDTWRDWSRVGSFWYDFQLAQSNYWGPSHPVEGQSDRYQLKATGLYLEADNGTRLPSFSVRRSGHSIIVEDNNVVVGPKLVFRGNQNDIKQIFIAGSTNADRIRIGDVGKPITIYGLDGDDSITGGNGAETIYGGAGNDQIHGGGGDDMLCGVGGDDHLWGDSGNDRLEGGGGRDHLNGGSGRNTLAGGVSVDSLTVRSKDKMDKDKLDKLTITK